MSKELTTATTATSETEEPISVTSYSGGERGQMLQITQATDNQTFGIVHADTEQVQDLVHTLQMWLNR